MKESVNDGFTVTDTRRDYYSPVWPDKIPDSWKMTKVHLVSEEHRETVKPDTLDREEAFHYSIPIIEETGDGRFESVDNIKSKKLRLSGGEVLISKLNPGKSRVLIAVNHDPVTLASSEFIPLYPDTQKILPKFLEIVLKSEPIRQYLEGIATSATKSHKRVSPTEIRNLRFPLPPIGRQRHIFHAIKEYSESTSSVISQKEDLNTVLEERRQSVLTQSITGDLLNNDIKEDTGIDWLGKIPGNWTVSQLKYQCSFEGGKTPAKSEPDYWDGDVPWFSAKDMKSEYLESSEETITERAVSDTQIPLLPPKTGIVVVRGMILDHTFPVGMTTQEATINQDLKALKPGENLKPKYLLRLLQGLSPRILAMTEESAHGTKRLDWNQVKEIEVPIPPLDEQGNLLEEIESELRWVRDLQEETQRSIDLLQEKRQALLTKAVSGQIDLSDWHLPDKPYPTS